MVSAVVLWCDRCFHTDPQTHEFGIPEQLGWEKEWREVHLCAACRVRLFQSAFAVIVEFFADYGEVITIDASSTPKPTRAPAARMKPPGKDEQRLPCLYCDSTFAGTSGLDRHLRAEHRLRTPEEFWGRQCPLCGNEFERLAQHVARGHVMHISLAFAEAERAGDVFNTVAHRRSAVLASV